MVCYVTPRQLVRLLPTPFTRAGTGVAAGGHRFLTMRPQFQGPETLKLKANRALNSVGEWALDSAHVGMFARPLANGAGIIGLYFATADSLIYNKLDQNGLPDYLSSVLAGGVTGALFRSPRGPRQAAVAGAVGVVAGAGIVAARTKGRAPREVMGTAVGSLAPTWALWPHL
eukprot:356348-Chlamydomonas_euryale.AAC.20